TRPQLIFADSTEINAIELETWTNITLLDDLKGARSVDYHYEKGLIFWTDVIGRHISVTGITNDLLRKNEAIVRTKMGVSFGMAVDWINDHIYWTDETFQSVHVSNLQGENRRTLIANAIEKPRGVAITPSDRILFFSDCGSTYPRIERCGLDGKDRETIVANVGEPISLTIDHKVKRIYWTDRLQKGIYSAKFDGSSIKTVMKNSNYLAEPYGIAVHKDKVYWTNWRNGEILRTDKYASYEVEKVFSSALNYPIGLVVYDNTEQQTWGRNVKILHTEEGKISETDIDSGHRNTLSVMSTAKLVGIDYDYDRDLMFWTDSYNQNIYVQIHVCDYYGVHRKTFVTKELVYPDALALSPKDGLMFFSDFDLIFGGKILRSAMDGSERKTIINKGVNEVFGMAIDQQGRRIYWTDASLQTIKSATFDGTDVHTIITFTEESSPNPYGIDVYGEMIYWTNNKDRSVYTVHKYTGIDNKPFLTNLDSPKHMKIVSKESQKEGVNRCGENNGHCDHLCLPVPVTPLTSKGYSCACSDGFLLEDNVHCILKESAKLVKDEL
ncbi:Hypothetical predicted protein, partial [Mytilus galloprovincialis]